MSVKYRILIFALFSLVPGPCLAAVDCARGYAAMDPFFSRDELAEIRELRHEATDLGNSPAERREALEDLLGITQARFKELGFTTRRRTIPNEEFDGGKETFLQILEAPGNLPVGRVIQGVQEKYGMRVGVNPILEKSAMDTPAYFGETENLTMLDLLTFKDKGEVSQDLHHEIRHRYFLQLKREGKADVHLGSVSALSPRFHLEKAGGPYDRYISFEELSTYHRDALAEIARLEKGKGTKKHTRDVLRSLKRLSQGIVKALDANNWEHDLTVYSREKEVILPIYRGKEKVAEITMPLPDMTADMDVVARMKRDLGRVRVIAEERIKFAEEELRKLR